MIKTNYFLFLLLILLTPITVIASERKSHQSGHLEFNLKPDTQKKWLIHPKSLINLSSQEINNFANRLTSHYLKKQKISDFPSNLTLKQAHIIQNKLIQSLLTSQGKIIGYKAGLTNKQVQAKFNTNQPILGSLLTNMLLPSETTVTTKFGAIPRLEGDLMVRVKSEKINRAKTPEETLEYIDTVIPFLELPDLMYSQNLRLKKEMLIAINVGARLGIVGTPIEIQPTQEWQKRLKKIQVIITDESGKELATGESKSLLGDPLNVVLWIKDQLQSQGKSLKKGDLLSLGSITPLIPVKPQTRISAHYLGLEQDSPVKISVYFQE